MMALVVILSGGFNLLNLISWGALSPYFVFENSEWYRLITSMVLHGSIFHLIMNMYVLFYLGAFMEKILGKIKPNLVFILKVSAKSSKLRLKKRKSKNRYDNFAQSFYNKAQQSFLKIAKNKKNYFVLDSSFNDAILEKKIFNIVKKYLNI